MALTIPLSEIVERSNNRLLGKHESWGRVLLGDIATVLNGFAFKSSEFSNSGGVPLIRIRDVGKDRSETTYLGEYDPRYVVEPGDLLVGMDGDFNCARWCGPLGLLNQRVCKITLKSDIYLPKFLDCTLPGYLKAINDVTSSVTVKHLSSKSIEEIPLPLPPKEVQQLLVAEIEKQFSRLDEAVASLKRTKSNLKRYRAAVLKAAVEGKLTEDWRKQHPDVEPGSKLLERILVQRRVIWYGKGKYKEPAVPKTLDLPALPEGWVWITTGQLCDCIVPNRDKPKSFSGNIPWLTLPDFDDDQIAITKSKEELGLTPQEVDTYNAKVVPQGSVVMSCIGRFGITAVLSRDAIINQQLHAFLPNENVLPRYLAYALRTRTEEMRARSAATTIAYLNKDKCNSVRVPLPSLPEQEYIVAEVERRLSVIDELEATVEANLTRADRLRQSILSQAFAGKLVGAGAPSSRNVAQDLPVAAEPLAPFGVIR